VRGLALRIDRRRIREQLVERRVERQPCSWRVPCVEDDLERQVERIRELNWRGDVAACGGELGFGAVDRAPAFDDALRKPDKPRRPRECVANRAADPEARERVEGDPAFGVICLYRIE